MEKLNKRPPGAAALQSYILAGRAVMHSLRARGPWRTFVFAVLGLGLPALAEYRAINVTRVLRHHGQPRVKEVPVSVVLSWYTMAYATFALMESIWSQAGVARGKRRWLLPASTALVATSLDLALDPFGLEQGLWEWNSDGPYAAEIAGANGKHGVPLANFAGWLGLTGSVTLGYGLLAGNTRDEGTRPGAAGSVKAGRAAARLLLPFYLPAATWALRQRKPRYLLYSALVPLVLLRALTARRPST